MYDVLVKNGRIVTADRVSEGNIAIRDGKIAAVLNAGEEPEAAKVIDAKGNYVFPGAIDTHAHLNDPGYEWREDYEHGTAAAALGGYTTVIDMPLQNEPAMVNAEAFDFKLKKVDPNAYCDYCFWGGLIPDNFKDLKDLDEKGCVAFKSFIGPVSPDYSSLNYGQAYEAMEIIKEFDGRAGFHCEDFSMIKNLEKIEKAKDPNSWQCFLDSRPVAAEMVATVDIIEIAKATGCKAHICHVSSPDVAQKIKEAREQGDLSENAEYDAAKDEQRDIEARIEELEKILKNAEVVVEDEVDLDRINIGCQVKILDLEYDEELDYKIVGSTEANSLKGKISNESPVGKALIGAKIGDIVEVETQAGVIKYKVLEIERSN